MPTETLRDLLGCRQLYGRLEARELRQELRSGVHRAGGGRTASRSAVAFLNWRADVGATGRDSCVKDADPSQDNGFYFCEAREPERFPGHTHGVFSIRP
jgi:hypothetical protein